MIHKKAAIIGLIVCLLYFISVVALLAVGNQASIIFMETVTMLSGIYMVALIAALPYPKSAETSFTRTLAISFAASGMVITNVVHFVYMTVISPMADSGIIIPDYLTLGVYPSVIMAADYLAWGLFIGLAYIFSSFTAKEDKHLRYLLLINGCLCIAGLLGVVLINENLWYIAPVGYGLGTAVCCIRLLVGSKEKIWEV